MNQPTNMNGHRSRRRLKIAVLCTCVLLAGVLAAVLIAALHRGRRGNARETTDVRATGQREARGNQDNSGGSGMLDSMMGWAGLRKLAGEPGGISPPPGAERLYASARESANMAEEFARYSYPGGVEAAAAHYERLLGEKGFRRLADQPQNRGAVMSFQKDTTYVTVSLRKDGEKCRIVTVALVVRRQGR